MKFSNFFGITVSFVFILLFTSCSEDLDNTSENFITTEARGPNGGRNDGGGNDGRGNGGRGNGGNDQDNDQNTLGNPNENNANRVTSAIIQSWNDVFLQLDQDATGMRPNATARAIAYINLAAYETAVPFMNDFQSNERSLQGLRIDEDRRRRDAKVLPALNATYAAVLDHFLINVPSDTKSSIQTTFDANTAILSQDLSDREMNDSEQWGEYIAQQIITFAQSDIDAEQQITQPQPLSYEPPTGEGYWTYSADPERALFPYWKSVRTFAISSEETSSVAPIAYSAASGSDYFNQMMEVYEVNNAARDADGEQLWIAEFWSDDVEGLMISPPGRQVSIADQLIEQFGLSLEEGLVLMLKLGFALNDAAVSTWADKYEYMVMRPNVFIHDYIDPNFQTNLYRLVYWPNPSFPGYPSGHSCFASAAGGVFIAQFGDNVRFTDTSHEGRTEFRGTPRTFTTISEMAAENAYSRIPLGVHIRMDCDEGLRLGYEIADAVNNMDLTRRGPG